MTLSILLPLLLLTISIQDAIYKIHFTTKGNQQPQQSPLPPHTLSTANLASVLVLGDEGGVELQAGAHKVLDNKAGVDIDRVDGNHNIGQDGDANEALETAAELTDNVNVVVAALGAEGDAVKVAVAEAEQAGDVLNQGEDGRGQRDGNVGSNDGKAKDFGVEDDEGIGERLDKDAGEGSRGGAERGADGGGEGDVELDVEVDAQAQGGDLSLDLGLGAEGEGVEGDLAPGMGGVVLCELGRRDGAEGAQLDLGSRSVALGQRPGAGQERSRTSLESCIIALAGKTRAGLDPGAVGHGGRALEALGEGQGRVDVARCRVVDLVAELDVGGSRRAGWHRVSWHGVSWHGGGRDGAAWHGAGCRHLG